MADTAKSPMLAFATYTTPKQPYSPPMLAFATYTTPKQPYSPPMLAFVTYADNVEPDDKIYINTQLESISVETVTNGEQIDLKVSWALNGLDHGEFIIKVAPTEGNVAVGWDEVSTLDIITTDTGEITFTYNNVKKGYKYFLEAIGVDVNGNMSEPTKRPKLEFYVAMYEDTPAPDQSLTDTQVEGLSAVVTEQNKQKGITVSWGLNGLSYANITVKQAPSKGYNYVDWSTVVGKEYSGNVGETSMTILPLVEGYVYQVVAAGVDSEGKKSNPDNNPQLIIFISESSAQPTDPSKPNPGGPGLPTDTENPDSTFDRITGDEFLTKYAIRQRISDAIETGYTNDELLAYINDAINMVWTVMIQMDYDEIAGYLTMTERKVEIPSNYWMPTGKPPVQRYNHMLYCYGDLPCTFRYWTRPRFLRTLQDTLPQGTVWFNTALLNLIAQMVVTLAMQNHGFDMGAEMDFTTSIAKLLPK